jgi:hypothetical protein
MEAAAAASICPFNNKASCEKNVFLGCIDVEMDIL